MSPFWHGFEKDAVFLASAAHVGQNAYMLTRLKNQGFARRMGREFQEGIQGKSPSALRQFGHAVASGATVPEIKMFQDHSRELGSHAAKALKERGVNSLSIKDISVARSLTQGRFSRLLDPKHFDQNSKTHQALLDIADKHLGTGVSSAMLSGLPKHELAGRLESLEKAWRSKDSPMTSNMFANLTKNPGQAKFRPRRELSKVTTMVNDRPIDLKPKASLAGGLIGSAATGAVDHATGVLNAAKVMTTNQTGRQAISSVPGGGKLLSGIDRRFLKNPLIQARDQGLAGQQLSPLASKLKTYGLNSATAQMANSTNRMSFAANKAAPEAFAQVPGKIQKTASFWQGFEKRAGAAPSPVDEWLAEEDLEKRKLKEDSRLHGESLMRVDPRRLMEDRNDVDGM